MKPTHDLNTQRREMPLRAKRQHPLVALRSLTRVPSICLFPTACYNYWCPADRATTTLKAEESRHIVKFMDNTWSSVLPRSKRSILPTAAAWCYFAAAGWLVGFKRPQIQVVALGWRLGLYRSSRR
ncbi:hypothetical protein R1flu_017843 [Riccia fluitans]|uniref:Uncharacterized protein n=1 Tax=Riccia fluitans TaxID=41844 RepID=A0ABD1ZFF0_9MARC